MAECRGIISVWFIAEYEGIKWAGSMAIDSSIKVVGRESVDGLWMDTIILLDDPLHALRFVSGLSGPCIEKDDEGGTTGLRPSYAVVIARRESE
jgi:hypothetical protein